MRALAGIASIGFITAAATLGLFAGVSRADHVICLPDPANESCLNHTLTLPGVAKGDFFVPVNQMSVQAGCVSRPAPTKSFILGFSEPEEVATVEDNFQINTFAAAYGEPSTQTGILNAELNGPGGPYFASGDLLNGEAALDFGLLEGPGTYTVTLPGDTLSVHQDSSTTVVNVPEDCVSRGERDGIFTNGNSIYTFDPTVPGGWLVTKAEGSATISNGNCDPFIMDLTISFFANGTATSLQTDTGDFNQGFFWPGPPVGDYGPEVGDDWFNLFVQNPNEPEAYLGAVSPDLTRIVGRTAWKNCLWDFELLVIGLVLESE